MSYAKRVKADPSRSILSPIELRAHEAEFGSGNAAEGFSTLLNGRQKAVLVIFGLSFVVMMLGIIPWSVFGVDCFGWTAFLTGLPFGEWYFDETTALFIIVSLLVAVAGGLSQREYVDAFVKGVGEIISVVLVIALARSITVLMSETGLDQYILTSAASALSGVSAVVLAPLSYLLYLVLSFLVPSSSGLATLSVPIMGPLAAKLGFSVETMIMIYTAGNGLVNLFTPTCGFIMGGLAITKIEYTTWLKFSAKIIGCIALFSVVFLTAAMVIL